MPLFKVSKERIEEEAFLVVLKNFKERNHFKDFLFYEIYYIYMCVCVYYVYIIIINA